MFWILNVGLAQLEMFVRGNVAFYGRLVLLGKVRARPFMCSGAATQKAALTGEVRRLLNTAVKPCLKERPAKFARLPFWAFWFRVGVHVFLLGQNYPPNADGRRVWQTSKTHPGKGGRT